MAELDVSDMGIEIMEAECGVSEVTRIDDKLKIDTRGVVRLGVDDVNEVMEELEASPDAEEVVDVKSELLISGGVVLEANIGFEGENNKDEDVLVLVSSEVVVSPELVVIPDVVVISEDAEVTPFEVSVAVSVVVDNIRLVLELKVSHAEIPPIGVVVSVAESPAVEVATSVIDGLIADAIVSVVEVSVVDVVIFVIDVLIADVVIIVRKVSIVDVIVSFLKVVMSIVEALPVAIFIVDVVMAVVNVSTADIVVSVVAVSIFEVSIADTVVSDVEISVVEVAVITNESEPLLEGLKDDNDVETASEADGLGKISVEEDSTLVEVSIIVVLLVRDKDIEERGAEVDQVASCDVKYTDDNVDEVNDGLDDVEVKSAAMPVVE